MRRAAVTLPGAWSSRMSPERAGLRDRGLWRRRSQAIHHRDQRLGRGARRLRQRRVARCADAQRNTLQEGTREEVVDAAGPPHQPPVSQQAKRNFRGCDRGRGPATPGWASSVCAGDYDNDGWTDLFLTSFGQNALYRNSGGRFEDATAAGLDLRHPVGLGLYLRRLPAPGLDPAADPWRPERMAWTLLEVVEECLEEPWLSDAHATTCAAARSRARDDSQPSAISRGSSTATRCTGRRLVRASTAGDAERAGSPSSGGGCACASACPTRPSGSPARARGSPPSPSCSTCRRGSRSSG